MCNHSFDNKNKNYLSFFCERTSIICHINHIASVRPPNDHSSTWIFKKPRFCCFYFINFVAVISMHIFLIYKLVFQPNIFNKKNSSNLYNFSICSHMAADSSKTYKSSTTAWYHFYEKKKNSNNPHFAAPGYIKQNKRDKELNIKNGIAYDWKS